MSQLDLFATPDLAAKLREQLIDYARHQVELAELDLGEFFEGHVDGCRFEWQYHGQAAGRLLALDALLYRVRVVTGIEIPAKERPEFAEVYRRVRARHELPRLAA